MIVNCRKYKAHDDDTPAASQEPWPLAGGYEGSASDSGEMSLRRLSLEMTYGKLMALCGTRHTVRDGKLHELVRNLRNKTASLLTEQDLTEKGREQILPMVEELSRT
jgi:hypothetical protein